MRKSKKELYKNKIKRLEEKLYISELKLDHAVQTLEVLESFQKNQISEEDAKFRIVNITNSLKGKL